MLSLPLFVLAPAAEASDLTDLSVNAREGASILTDPSTRAHLAHVAAVDGIGAITVNGHGTSADAPPYRHQG